MVGDQNIAKARGCFYQYGSLGSFQGDINPLLTKFVIDICIIPVNTYIWDVETGFSHDALLQTLAYFLAKRALKWPAHFFYTAALVCVRRESIKARIFFQEPAFLKHLLSQESDGVGAATMHSLLNDPDSLWFVRDLEISFGTRFTEQVLSDADT